MLLGMSMALTTFLALSGKTQAQFAAEVGVRPATVSAWVNGKVPRPPQMKKIADATEGKVPVTVWFQDLSERASA